MKVQIDINEIKDFFKIARGNEVTISSNDNMLELVGLEKYNRKITKVITKTIEHPTLKNGDVTISKKLIDLFKSGEVTITDNSISQGDRIITFISNLEEYKSKHGFKEILNIDAEEFKKATEVIYAVAEHDVRPILRQVYFNGNEVVALDGYRLAKRILSKSVKESILVHADVLKAIRKVKGANAKIEINDEAYRITIGDFKIIAPKVEGEFVSYNKLIPKEYSRIVRVLNKDITEAIRAIRRLSNLSIAKLYIQEECVQIKSDTRIAENKVEFIDTIAADLTGEEIKIAFNPKYLMDIFNTKEMLEIKLNNDISPVVVTGENRTDLILPIRVCEGAWDKA